MESKMYLFFTFLINFLLLVLVTCDNNFNFYESKPSQKNEQENRYSYNESPQEAYNKKYVTIPYDYEHIPGFNYYKLHKTLAVWADARDACKKEGAYLAVPNTKEKANLLAAIFNLYPGDTYVFIGISDYVKTDNFVSVKNEPMTDFVTKNWAPGQPQLGGRGYCLCLNKQGQVVDINCYTPLFFICEKEYSG